MADLARNLPPNISEIYLFAHLEHLAELHHLRGPLAVTVTDAKGRVTEYDFYPQSTEEVNAHRRGTPGDPKFEFPVMIRITDMMGNSFEHGPTQLEPNPEWFERRGNA